MSFYFNILFTIIYFKNKIIKIIFQNQLNLNMLHMKPFSSSVLGVQS